MSRRGVHSRRCYYSVYHFLLVLQTPWDFERVSSEYSIDVASITARIFLDSAATIMYPKNFLTAGNEDRKVKGIFHTITIMRAE